MPAVAAKIAVPAAPPTCGTTFALADTTVNGRGLPITFRINRRPMNDAGAGNVTVQVAAPLKIIDESVVRTA